MFDGNKFKFIGVWVLSLMRVELLVWGMFINLFIENMDCWIILENNQFKMVDGIMMNVKKGGNLIFIQKFDDFKFSIEFCYFEGSNSGIYFCGCYEIQIEDFKGRVDDVSIGGVYGFIVLMVNVVKVLGEWQIYEIILVGRYVMVVFNGVEVIFNWLIFGIIGGLLDSNEGEFGLIMIQGDYGLIDFCKFVVMFVVN